VKTIRITHIASGNISLSSHKFQRNLKKIKSMPTVSHLSQKVASARVS
jgi:hypothetical protein